MIDGSFLGKNDAFEWNSGRTRRYDKITLTSQKNISLPLETRAICLHRHRLKTVFRFLTFLGTDSVFGSNKSSKIYPAFRILAPVLRRSYVT